MNNEQKNNDQINAKSELKEVADDNGKLCLTNPKVAAKLEHLVFNEIEKLPAKAWLGCLALLLVAKCEDEDSDGIQMSINGINIGIELLPPDEDYNGGEDEDEEVEGE